MADSTSSYISTFPAIGESIDDSCALDIALLMTCCDSNLGICTACWILLTPAFLREVTLDILTLCFRLLIVLVISDADTRETTDVWSDASADEGSSWSCLTICYRSSILMPEDDSLIPIVSRTVNRLSKDMMKLFMPSGDIDSSLGRLF